MSAVPFKANADRRHHIPKQQDRVTNWSEYDAGLRQRGNLIDWDTPEMDCDSARATTITEAKVISDGYKLDHFQRVLIASRDPQNRLLDMLTLATFLY